MQSTGYPERDVVLVGGGHTHALVMRAWAMDPPPNARLTLINPGPFPPYSGMLPGFVAGHYSREDMVMDLVPLARFASARLILDAATGIDPETRQITLRNRPPIAYDLCSFDVGINAHMPEIDGFSEHGAPVKPFELFVANWSEAVKAMVSGARPPQIAVIGAGVAGVELSLAMHHHLSERGLKPLITLVESAGEMLSSAHPKTRRLLLEALQSRGIACEVGARVVRVSPDAAHLADGREIPSSLTISAAGARPHDWLVRTGLTNDAGYLETGSDLRVVGHSDIFAVGDCGHFAPDPRPKAGVFAVRQAPALLANLRACLKGAPTRPYHPQSSFLKLISTGGKEAIAERGGLVFKHPILWRWKDQIDQKFMNKFNDFPSMPTVDTPPLCGGCGAKIGSQTLASVTASLAPPSNPAILSRPGDDAAIIARGTTHQVLTTDHLRGFTEDSYLMARIAAVHALGDIWAMGARPEAILVNLTLPRAHPRIHQRMLGEIMLGISEVASQAGADIVGGHTTEGAELSIGLSITGLADSPIGLSGAQPGDALILTKPIGTGTVLAGEMTYKSRGDWLAATHASMTRPLAQASEILAPKARAMTDVTGFGLAGHLANMMRESQATARIDPGKVPLLPGAVELAQTGIRSSLFPANAAATPLGNNVESPRTALLHDPQTAGGLLAAVPPGEADKLLEHLAEAGDVAARIGVVEKQSSTLAPLLLQ